MAIRDNSPAQWLAPGTATLALQIIFSADGPSPIPLDVFLSNYAPKFDETINLASGFQSLAIPDLGVNGGNTTNCRTFVLIPPRGNTTSIILKGVTGDTGRSLHPNQPLVLSLPASDALNANGIGLTTGGIITGCRVLFF
jgi:hypothetical protein